MATSTIPNPTKMLLKSGSKSLTIAASGTIGVSLSDLSITIPTGYSMFSVVQANTDNGNTVLRGIGRADNTSANICWFRNMSASQITANATIVVAFMPT